MQTRHGKVAQSQSRKEIEDEAAFGRVPAFLLKTYDLVGDECNADIVSWEEDGQRCVLWAHMWLISQASYTCCPSAECVDQHKERCMINAWELPRKILTVCSVALQLRDLAASGVLQGPAAPVFQAQQPGEFRTPAQYIREY